LKDIVADVRHAIAWNDVPNNAGVILEMLKYWDGESAARTGIDDSSAGLPPDALQNVTAKASAMIEQKGIARAEQMIRTIAMGGLKKAFKGILKLFVETADRERVFRLRDQWVSIDPRSWNVGMDVSINTGLGTGTRERDMMTMQAVMAVQEKLVAGFGPDNPFVKPDNVWNAVSALVEASGLRTPTMYFTKPDPQEVEAMLESRRNAKPMEIQVIEAKSAADMQAKQADIPMEIEKERIKVEAAKQKEIAQGQAAVEERIAIAKINANAKAGELELKRYEIDEKIRLGRDKMAQEREIAEQGRDNELQRRKADSIGRELANLNTMASAPAKDSGETLLQVLQSMQKKKRAKVVRDANGDMESVEFEDVEPEGAVN
jgi:hypothetical protein